MWRQGCGRKSREFRNWPRIRHFTSMWPNSWVSTIRWPPLTVSSGPHQGKAPVARPKFGDRHPSDLKWKALQFFKNIKPDYNVLLFKLIPWHPITFSLSLNSLTCPRRSAGCKLYQSVHFISPLFYHFSSHTSYSSNFKFFPFLKHSILYLLLT